MQGIFLGNRRTLWAANRSSKNLFLIDLRNIAAFILFRLESLFNYSFSRRTLLAQWFARVAGKILKKNKEYNTIYVRQGSVEEFVVYLRNLDQFHIKKIVFELHDLEFAIPGFFHSHREQQNSEKTFQEFLALVVKNHERVQLVTLTKNLADLLQEKYHFPYPIEVIPDAHDFYETNQKTIDFSKEKIEILYTGLNFGPTKGIEFLIEALAFLDTRFYIKLVGGSEKDRERLSVKYLHHIEEKRLLLVAAHAHAEIKDIMKKADIAVIPLPAGGFSEFTSPLKLFEYMSVGMPIVASDIPVLREILTDTENALLFEPNNSEDLAKKIEFLAEHQELALHLSKQAQQDSQRYTYQKRAQKIMHLLNR